jgi:hypothetical protein
MHVELLSFSLWIYCYSEWTAEFGSVDRKVMFALCIENLLFPELSFRPESSTGTSSGSSEKEISDSFGLLLC